MKFLTWSFLLLAMVALSRAAAAAGTTEAPEKEKTNEKGELFSKYCQVYSGNLASVQNLYEFRAIQGVAYGRNPQGPAAWIGGSAAEQNGYWFWSDGSRFRYASWCRGKPKNRSGQECIRLNFKNCKTRCMDDANCRSRNPFICARKTY
ncbi:galactose-specific lectin nattectin-like [Leuresthes tenuis]|uniref:galactose-specific lectin nattectin-like n=1 Tax=Leuresthes tenuis TaxID=355514 RepID=UPI003B50BEC8